MSENAIACNKMDNLNYVCRHVCIDPYKEPWQEGIGIEILREKIEDIPKTIFENLSFNDILFIDSSHIIRPQGDVLFECLEILPFLKSGVIVHRNDIFTPKDYPDEWIYDRHYLYNEQYLLEAFLSFNTDFRIISAFNYLAHKHRDELSKKCPFFAKQKVHDPIKSEPRAFWLLKK